MTRTLISHARDLVYTSPDDIALVLLDHAEERSITYGAFFAGAQRYAHALERAGIGRGDLVVLVLEHGEPLLYSFWGALLLGAIPSIFPFLSDKLDRDRYFANVRALIVHSGARAVIASDDLRAPLADALLGVDTTLLALNDVGDSNTDDYLARDVINEDDTAFLQHSSGSTGLQKGVMLSHRAVLNQLDAYRQAIRLSPDDVVVSWLPLYHDMGLIAGFILPITLGVKLVLMSPFQWVRDPKLLLHAITRHRGTVCWQPNFAYNFLATRIRDSALEGVDLRSWRAAINCSEPVYAESHRMFLDRFRPYGFRADALATCYALAENTFAVTQAGIAAPLREDTVDRDRLTTAREAEPARHESPALTFVSCGTPIPECAIQIADDTGQPLPERRVGEVWVRSNSMLDGYFNRPDATAQVLVDGWYRTGDMGYVADGELYITGRRKDLIIVGGKNIYPQDIENLLNDIVGLHPGRAAAFGVPNEALGTEDIAIVAESDTDDIDEQGDIMREIRRRVTQTLDVTIRYIHLVDSKWLVKTSSGKIARGANRDKFLDHLTGQHMESLSSAQKEHER